MEIRTAASAPLSSTGALSNVFGTGAVRLLRYGAAMANFVLVAGARLGAWAWDEVVPYLRAAATTLTR
nr:hypothetical protein GCM10020093_001810 [Planobispora longispora]